MARVEQLGRAVTLIDDLRRPVEAERILRGLLIEDPNDPEALRLLSYALNHQSRSDEALAAANQAVESAPNNPEAHLAVAHAHASADNQLERVRAAEWAVQLAPNWVRGHGALVEAIIAWSRLGGGLRNLPEAAERAEASASAMLRLAPNAAMTHLIQAQLLLEAGRREQAALAARTALSIEPTSVLGKQLLALSTMRPLQRKRATGYMAEAVRLDPKEESARSMLRSVSLSPLRAMLVVGFVGLFLVVNVTEATTGVADLVAGSIAALVVALVGLVWYVRERPEKATRVALREESKHRWRQRCFAVWRAFSRPWRALVGRLKG